MDFKINIPEGARYILDKLGENGFEAYAVGGCVRDSILGRVPHDWDICTSALPDEVCRVFAGDRVIPTGLKHGTVTILLGSEPYEVTTYRVDGVYSDNRRPDSVTFTSSLTEDLRRRDFTVNAMAYNPALGLADPFGGREDLKNKIIRCVGNPDERFDEDALRVLRAWRLACQLGFEIDADTLSAAERHSVNLKNISAERMRDELVKALESADGFVKSELEGFSFLKYVIPEWERMDIPQNNPHHIYNVGMHTVKALDAVSGCGDIVIKLVVLLHDIGKPLCYSEDEKGIGHFYGHAKESARIADDIMTRLRFDNDTRRSVTELVMHHDIPIENNARSVKRRLNKLGERQLRRLIEVKRADARGQNPMYTRERLEYLDSTERVLDTVLSEQQCFSMKDLAVNGRDLIEIGYTSGTTLGAALGQLLEEVIAEKIENDREVLIKRAAELMG